MEAVQPAISKLKPRFIVMNLIMYAIFITLLIVDYVWFRRSTKQVVSYGATTVEKIVFIYTGLYFHLVTLQVLSILLLLLVFLTSNSITELGFFFYGTRIHLKFSKLQINSQSIKRILTKIQLITYLISSCFIVRAVIIFWGTFWNLSVVTKSLLPFHYFSDLVF